MYREWLLKKVEGKREGITCNHAEGRWRLRDSHTAGLRLVSAWESIRQSPKLQTEQPPHHSWYQLGH